MKSENTIEVPLLAFIALSAAQSSAQTHIHSPILVIDTPNNASYNQVHWLVRTPYLSIKASNVSTVTAQSDRFFFYFVVHLSFESDKILEFFSI